MKKEEKIDEIPSIKIEQKQKKKKNKKKMKMKIKLRSLKIHNKIQLLYPKQVTILKLIISMKKISQFLNMISLNKTFKGIREF